MTVSAFKSPLDALAGQVAAAPQQVCCVQPVGGGQLREYTWQQLDDEARRMAAHLRGLDFPAGSHIGLMSKNCAEWIIADLAIWMAGHVTVPLYPTLAAKTVTQILEHSESKLLFVGKLDDWDGMKAGVPGGLPCIAFSLAPQDAGPISSAAQRHSLILPSCNRNNSPPSLTPLAPPACPRA